MHPREANKRESEIRASLVATKKLLTEYLKEYQEEAKPSPSPASIELLQRTKAHMVAALDALFDSSVEREQFFLSQEKELTRVSAG